MVSVSPSESLRNYFLTDEKQQLFSSRQFSCEMGICLFASLCVLCQHVCGVCVCVCVCLYVIAQIHPLFLFYVPFLGVKMLFSFMR